MEDIIYGRNSVMELLNSTSRTINKLLIIKGDSQGSIKKIISLAREKHIVISEVTKQKMDELAEGGNHQGVIALTTAYEYCEIDDILNVADEKKEKPLVLILDGIEDPHNLGAIIRTAECMGVHGIIIPKRRAAMVNSTVMKVAAGALEHMKISRVTNINDTIEELKEKGLWIIGTDASGRDSIQNIDLKSPVAIVIGSEGEGMSNLTRKRCDILTKIDMKGHITSLNASVSAGMVVYEACRQRNK
jgi:23S rRNA (guanosine2251-2'-O)-methyltransferase